MPETSSSAGEPSDSPRVSVIIPTHNRRDLVRFAIESVLEQEPHGMPLELIVVDDGSKDGTAEVVARYPTVRYVRSEACNISSARNAGIAIARGQWFGFLDDDDVWLPHKMKRITAALELHPEARIVMSSAYSCDWNLNPDHVWQPPAPQRRGGIYQGFMQNVMTPSALVIHKSVFDTLGGFDANAHRIEDRELCLRAARAGVPFLTIDEPLILYRRRSRVDGDQVLAGFRSTLALLRREFREQHADQPSLLRQQVYELNLRRWCTKALLEAAREQALDRNWLEARRFDTLALRVSPLHWVYHRVLFRKKPGTAKRAKM